MPLKILFTVALLVPAMAIAQGRPLVSIDSNLYPYQSQIDNDTDLTFITNARLPARFSYFSYINFRGAASGDSFEFTRPEQTLRWGIAENLPLDLSEFFDRINLIYRITFQLKRFGSTDNKAWQTEQYLQMKFPQLSERVYLSGFIDQTFDLDHAVVEELLRDRRVSCERFSPRQ
jgi:hypothetical protein